MLPLLPGPANDLSTKRELSLTKWAQIAKEQGAIPDLGSSGNRATAYSESKVTAARRRADGTGQKPVDLNKIEMSSKIDKKHDSSATLLFMLGALAIYVLGLIARFRALDDKVAVVAFSLFVDTIFVLALALNQHLVRRGAKTALDARAMTLVFGLSLLSTLAMLGIVFAAEKAALFGIAPLNLGTVHRVIYYFFIFSTFNFAGLWLHIQFEANRAVLRALAAERAAQHAEIRRLRQQLDPNFIFNGLNLIAVDINDQPKRALALLREMSHFLRLSMAQADIAFAPVGAEIGMLRAILEIHALRSDFRLVYRIEVAPAARDRLIPTALARPLVEQAVILGIPNRDGQVSIAVTIEAVDDGLQIDVTHSGSLRFGDMGADGDRLGARLDLHYPGRHTLSRRQEGDHVRTSLRLQGPPA